MNIWIIAQYSSTPETGMGGRYYYFAKELAKQGHKVHLIAGSYSHILRQPPILDKDYMVEHVSKDFNFVWIKTSKYSNSWDKKRVLNWFKFAWKLLKLSKVIKDKPDAILYSSPSLIPFLSAQRLTKKFKAKLIFDVCDIWPLTLIEFGGYSPKNPFICFMQWIEDKAYKDSDIVISNLPNAVEHMVARGMVREKFLWIPNGFHLSELENPEPLSISIKSVLPKNKFIIGYTGTIGAANALDTFINTARLLKDYKEIAFVLVGKGKDKSTLVEQAKDTNNVYFIEPVEKKQIQNMLAEFDVCYLGFKKKYIYRFGMAPIKLPEYMLAAKPIIHGYSGAHDFVEIAKAGLSTPAEDPEAVADAVLKLKNMPLEKRKQLGQNGRIYALEHHDYAKLTQKLVNVFKRFNRSN
jgi:glycosyltransferase involved in cell wall biosynthesis